MKTVIITGASRGIGKAIALAFAKHQWNIVIIASKSEHELFITKQEIESLGSRCLSFLGNVGNPDFAPFVIEQTIQHFSQIDCLINNAGISMVGLMTDVTPMDWDRILSTNLSSVFYFSRVTVPHMVHRKQGHIINISSVWGEVGASCEVAYSASKGGVNALTKALAKELAPSNISVNAISCGAIKTSMNEWLTEEEEQVLIDEIPAGRLGTATEVADLVYTTATSSSYFTGQIIRIDGGWI